MAQAIITEYIAKAVRTFQVKLTTEILALFEADEEVKVTPKMARELIKAHDKVVKAAEKKAEKERKAAEKKEADDETEEIRLQVKRFKEAERERERERTDKVG